MRILPFDWHSQASLASELETPFFEASARFVVDRPVALTLWRDNGVGLRIRSHAHDVSERIEVGVLAFDFVDTLFDDEKMLVLPEAFNHKNSITKLSIIESGAKANSGIIINGKYNSKIIVVAGVMPYSIAINGLGKGPRMFEPEYQIEDYIMTPMNH